uniref:Uncharacterized protein n=1 Tax=Plectus sambesii TaxID=2011161 RepID=A0A914X287_9BILA
MDSTTWTGYSDRTGYELFLFAVNYLTGVISIPLGVFVVIPQTVYNVAGPATLLSLIIAFCVLLICGLHMTELSCAMPKSCLVYNFAYSGLGEIVAFMIGWLSLLDYTIAISVVALAWSDHMNMLLNGSPHTKLMLASPFGDIGVPFMATNIDTLALIGLFFAMLLLCCSLRVAGTISVIMLIVSSLIICSSILVGFFYADPVHWVNAGFFKNGYLGMLQGTSYVLYSFVGIEALTFLLDETHHPRRRIPAVIPICNGLMSLIFFLVTMVVTLAIDITKLSPRIMLPEVYGVISVPAAKYILTVGSVCGLSGAGLAIFLPSTRLLSCMGADRLLCRRLAWMSKKKGAPLLSVLLTATCAALLTFIKRESLFDILSVNLPLRLLTIVCLTYLQHYTPEPVGLATETAKYQHIRRKQSMTSFLTPDGSVATLPRRSNVHSDDDEDDASESSNEFIQMYFCQTEAAKLQDRLEQEQESQATLANERSSLLLVNGYATGAKKLVSGEIAKSVSSYDTLLADKNAAEKPVVEGECPHEKILPDDANNDDGSLRTVSLCDHHSDHTGDSFAALNYGHNCIRSPCSLSGDSFADFDKKYHLYQREVPELPYYHEYKVGSTNERSETPLSQATNYKKAKRLLVAFLLTSLLTSLLLTKPNKALEDGDLWVVVPATIGLGAVCTLICVACLQKTNDFLSRRKHKVPGFPYLTCSVAFMLILMICSIDTIVFAKVFVWTAIGLLIYFLHGFRNSNESRCVTREIVLENEYFEDQAIVTCASSTCNSTVNAT